jgi:hypothetical protein
MRPLLLVVLFSTGCATAHLVGPPPAPPPPPRAAEKVLVLEPFFEDAEFEPFTVQQTYTGYSGAMNQPVPMVQTYRGEALPLFDRTRALAFEHLRAIQAARKLRPGWRVESTGALDSLAGPVTLVRVVVGQPRMTESNRTVKDLGLGFGFLILPLLVEVTPVHEELQVPAQITVFRSSAQVLKPKRLRYETQPDDAIDTRGLEGQVKSIVVTLAYEEGVLADDEPRNRLLLETFSDRLAAEIVRAADVP